MQGRAANNNKREEVPAMSNSTFRAHGSAENPYNRFNSHMRRDLLGRDEDEADLPPELFTSSRLPFGGVGEIDPLIFDIERGT